jgi:NAD(P)-dependent dehydrogenase (short-subunit alcohol dehydrogenase family)
MTMTGMFAVTGGGSGIGRGVCHRLAGEGARVAVLDVDGGAADEVAKEVGGEAHVLDVSDPARVGEVFSGLGSLQGLVSCAGISDVTPIVAMTAQAWRRVTDVHLDGTFFCLQAAARIMIAQGTGGTIVNTASINATFGHRGLSAYCAAKAGIAMLTRVAALELAQAGIRVNAVAPGIVETGMTSQVVQDPDFVRAWSAAIPLGRIGQPDDIADVVAFLCSPQSRWLTGQVLAADGGGSLRAEPKMFPDEAWSREALQAHL